MAYIDYYNVLGIDKNASQKEIKKAYRKKARKLHPDLNPNDKEAQRKFQEVNEAHQVLSNPEKRKKYDQYGEHWDHADQYEEAKRQQQQQAGASGFDGSAGSGFGAGPGSGFGGGGQQYTYTGNFDDDTFSDFFEEMFGGQARQHGRGRQAHFKGQDFNAELKIPLSQVYTSQKQTLSVNGKSIRLTIPAGVENGQTIRIKGHGGSGIQGGPKGDLYITFSIQNDTAFMREKDNLYKEVNVDLYTALLGGKLTIDTFDGQAKLKIKPGIQPGTRVKLKGKGFPQYKSKGQYGDLYLAYNIRLPQNLSAKEKELVKKLKTLRS